MTPRGRGSFESGQRHISRPWSATLDPMDSTFEKVDEFVGKLEQAAERIFAKPLEQRARKSR